MDDALRAITEQATALPKELRFYIGDSDWEGDVSKVAVTFGLDQDQTSRLRIETAFVLCALENISDLPTNIQNELHVPQNDAERISSAVISRVVAPVRAHLDPLQDEAPFEADPATVTRQQAQPQAAPAQPIAMLDDKLSSVIKLPSEETHYSEAGAPQPERQATPSAEPPKSSYEQGKDPYREPPM